MGNMESTPTPFATPTSTMDEDAGANNNTLMPEENRNENRNSRVRRYTDLSMSDDPWWWEIENENMVFDQVVPNVTTTTATTASNNENEVVLSKDFNSLLKIGETVNLTLSDTSNNSNLSDDNKRVAAAILLEASMEEKESENTNAQKTEYPVIKSLNASTANDELLNSAVASVINTREQTLEEFKEELRIKRLARQTAVQDLRDEIATLRKQLTTEQALTRQLNSTDTGDTVDDVEVVAETTTNAVAPNSAITDEIMLVDNDAVAAAAGDCACVDADDEDPQSRSRHANIELANAQLALQLANSDNLSLRTELGVVQKQVGTLKEVISCCKQMLTVKEEQCTQLKSKLEEIETSFGEKEMKIMSANLRQEYERQLGNIRQLRQLYEERQRISAAEHENLQRLLSIKKDELLAEQEKTNNFEERNQTLTKEVENANNELATLREECNEHKFEKKAVKEEMAVVNTLFSQMVLGFNGKNNLDIDRLTMMLEENRTLLNDMATKEINCSDGATLPKLLFELVEQAAVGNKASSRSPSPTFEVEVNETVDDGAANDRTKSVTVNVSYNIQNEEAEDTQKDIGATAIGYDSVDKEDTTAGVSSSKSASAKKLLRKNVYSNANISTSSPSSLSSSMQATTLKLHEPEVIGKVATAQEIIGNLPKVWKVLSHLLLSHHKTEQVQFEENGAGEDCYKSVETPNGPKAELSVSKTYIKLKDLILEKKSLVKETNRLKTLNCHLDYRLNEQEKRLSAVSLELTKTWHLVGKMQRQHRQLHTQEQILRYQLQQKRRLLTELKDELEYCRRKWAAARAKNDESQEQCDDLRQEFAKRKLEDANNSAESGYSDSGPASDEEERAGVVAAVSPVGGGCANGGGGGGNVAACRRKHLKEMFEHTRKIKRMQSTSPGRAAIGGVSAGVGGGGDSGGCAGVNDEIVEIVLRWNSAPPTCGWRTVDDDDAGEATTSRGAVPKRGAHSSRSAQRKPRDLYADKEEIEVEATDKHIDAEPRTERTYHIQRLEEQCKSLIEQVLETSDNREKLEVQLCRFQDEIAPVQYAVPLDEFINKKRIERMKRASSAPATGALTPREEEYTRKRSERLERLEEESRQLMSRIKRTSDRGHYLRCSLDRIRRAPSREGSFESNTEDDNSKTEETAEVITTATSDNDTLETATTAQEEFVNSTTITTTRNVRSPLTAAEEEYTARRTARLQRLEEDGKQLLASLSRNNERGSMLGNRLNTLHDHYGSNECTESSAQVAQDPKATTIEERIENIEKISTNREERLRILEEEGNQLISRLSNSSERGTQMINRIAERELNRQARSSATPSKDDATVVSVSGSEIAKTIGGESVVSSTSSNGANPVATALMPTLKNVACSSIVDEELTDCVTVTTTASQIAAAREQGAIPKLKPEAQLSAARYKTNRNLANKEIKSNGNGDTETLEDMVKRLKELPFPNDEENKAEETQPEQKELE